MFFFGSVTWLRYPDLPIKGLGRDCQGEREGERDIACHVEADIACHYEGQGEGVRDEVGRRHGEGKG